jgi:hypothetical protein
MTTVWSIIQARIESGLGERKGTIRNEGMFQRFMTGSVKGGH